MEIIKICYIIGQLRRGGAERQLYELVRGIDRNRFEPIVISLSQGGHWADRIRELNIQVIELERRKNKEFARLRRLIKMIRKIKPKIVHTCLFPANSYGRVAAILCRVPVIIASERSLPEIGKNKNKFEIYIEKLLSLFSHGIICNSLKAAEILKKYSFNAKKVFTVYNGVDATNFINVFEKEGHWKLARRVIGTVGSLEPVKNHKLFLDVAKIILNLFPGDDIKFLIVGNGSCKKELLEYANSLRITNKVVFAGERMDIPELLYGMDVFMMTSLYEGMSNAIMEAMLTGLPVIATDVGGNSELVINGETGFLCPTNSAETLAVKVMSLLENQIEAKRMGERGKEMVTNEFGIEKMVRKTEDIYIRLLKGT